MLKGLLLDLATMSEAELEETRTAFEPRWVRWNAIRTVLAIATSLLLLGLLLQL